MYIGYFSFDAHESGGRNQRNRSGSFTCLVEAESVGSAAEKFSNPAISLDDSFVPFERVGNIYLDDIIEVTKLPEQGMLARYEARTTDRLGTISTSLPGVPPEFYVSYVWGHGRRQRRGWYEPEPFLNTTVVIHASSIPLRL